MELASFGRALRKFWWLIVVTTVLGVGIAALLTARAQREYASYVTFFVSTPPSANGGTALQADQFAQLRVNSYVILARSSGLAKAVLDDPSVKGLGLDQRGVTSRLTASSQSGSVVLTVKATDSSKARSLALVTAVGNQFPKFVKTLDPEKSQTTLTPVSGPTLNSAPVSPRKKLNYGLGFLVGVAIGLAIAFLRELLDTSIRDPEGIDAATGLATIGAIDFEKAARTAPLIVQSQGRSSRAEAMRQLRTNLLFVDVDRPAQVIVVTSSVAAEGKSTTVANLAIVLAESNQRVLLIEADLRRPRVTDYLGIERAVGITNVLAGQVGLDDVLQPWGSSGLTVLPSGHVPPNPSELLGSEAMRELLAQLRQRFDFIVIDTPPLLPVTDAAVMATEADAVALVVRYGKTTRNQLATAVSSLESVDARVVGAILNMQPQSSNKRGRYDGYGYHEDAPGRDPAGAIGRRARKNAGVRGDSHPAGAGTPVAVSARASSRPGTHTGADAADRSINDELAGGEQHDTVAADADQSVAVTTAIDSGSTDPAENEPDSTAAATLMPSGDDQDAAGGWHRRRRRE